MNVLCVDNAILPLQCCLLQLEYCCVHDILYRLQCLSKVSICAESDCLYIHKGLLCFAPESRDVLHLVRQFFQYFNGSIALPHPAAGKVTLVRSLMKMSGTPATSDKAPPLLGQHTDEVLRDVLGRSGEDIATLRARGVV
jgi:hypothetical protein